MGHPVSMLAPFFGCPSPGINVVEGGCSSRNSVWPTLKHYVSVVISVLGLGRRAQTQEVSQWRRSRVSVCASTPSLVRHGDDLGVTSRHIPMVRDMASARNKAVRHGLCVPFELAVHVSVINRACSFGASFPCGHKLRKAFAVGGCDRVGVSGHQATVPFSTSTATGIGWVTTSEQDLGQLTHNLVKCERWQ